MNVVVLVDYLQALVRFIAACAFTCLGLWGGVKLGNWLEGR
jgi:hypothetical protein